MRRRRAGLAALRVKAGLLIGFCGGAFFGRAAASEAPAARVLLLANSEDPDSLRIARHYAAARHVPPENIVALKLPLTETITWREFVVLLWQPLLDHLVREKWIDAIVMEPLDALGRRKYVVNSHRMAALITCRGVPLKIAHDAAFSAEVLPFTSRAEFRTNAGAVDAELSLLAWANYPVNAFVPNPLFQNERPSAHDQNRVVKVSRLDGPTVEDALALVDRALAAERTGLLGRAYIDLSHYDDRGDAWFENTAAQLQSLDFDVTVDRESATIPASARFDAPVLYLGWYAGDIDGPFALPGFRFPPGAIALHLHSFSASTMRGANRGWTAPLVARGVTATVGNVYEPYMQFTHRPNFLVRALARGATLVDAAFYALPALSWQEVLIGDPLYRPFAVSLEEQLKNPDRLPPRLAGYAVLRRVRQLDAAKRGDEATALLVSAQRDTPSVALGLALAQRRLTAGDKTGAAAALGFIVSLPSFPTDEWALVRAAADLLEACEQTPRAVELWRRLLAEAALPSTVREPWLRAAAQAARQAGDPILAVAWERDADGLSAAKK